MKIRSVLPFIAFSAILLASIPALSQFAPPPAGASTIPAAQLIQAADLLPLLAQNDAGKVPFVIQVGSHIFYNEAHIVGSVYAGPGSQSAGLQLLEKTVASLPKDKLIVLYCGCCPWNRCPNVGPAFRRLHELGFTNVKVLYIANNFGDDWVAKGYPTAK